MSALIHPLLHEAGAASALVVDDETLRATDRLTLAMPRRMIVQRALNDDGVEELRLFYGAKEVSFDEPELFAFGETLAKQSTFLARDALAWGEGYTWSRIAPLLETLIAEEILLRNSAHAAPQPLVDRSRPSPLPPAPAQHARTWRECPQITQEITGRAVEEGHLELVVPIFRVAHMALDADGRQVGEANVFPRAVRVDMPTEWMTCIYAGTRYMVDKPMNVTGLKTMRAHFPQMMAALRFIRAHYLARYPDAENGWTIGHLERFATLVLAIPTYAFVKRDAPLAPGEMHPALSSLFRVTDGLRMTMHQMLFVPVGEPTYPFDTPMTGDAVYDYAERNYSFHSDTGVCAGPRHMVRMFLDVVMNGAGAQDDPFVFDPSVAAALADVERAFDYGLQALRAHAALFCLWPEMSRGYEDLAALFEAHAPSGSADDIRLRDRLRQRVAELRSGTYLAIESWRVDRERIYCAIDSGCARGLPAASLAVALPDAFAAARSYDTDALAHDIAHVLAATGVTAALANAAAQRIAAFCADTQAILRVAFERQRDVNRVLQRPAPTRAFEADDAQVYNLLQDGRRQPLPFLLTELRDAFGLAIMIATDRIDVARAATPPVVCPLTPSVDTSSPENTRSMRQTWSSS